MHYGVKNHLVYAVTPSGVMGNERAKLAWVLCAKMNVPKASFLSDEPQLLPKRLLCRFHPQIASYEAEKET